MTITGAGRLRRLNPSELIILADIAVYAGLFTSALLAATLLPASSEAVLVTLLASGGGEPMLLFAVATVGNVLGSVVNWMLGRFCSQFRDRRWFPISKAAFERASVHFRRFGVWSLLFAWLPIVGDPLTLIAGALRVRFLLFLALVAFGKLVRYAAVATGALWWAA